MSADAEARLAALLAMLRREGRQRSGLDSTLVPVDESAAYRVAARVADALGWPIAGWKIAANNPEMQRRLRASQPIYGRVFSSFVAESPAEIPHAALLHPLVECEYVVRLGADLPPRGVPYTEAEVAEHVATI
ncbi:MAG TPA: hypothetical protein VD970_11145, partial [Acetobacteraceae bacterium]|nr:hypothetical protein [Acetobacteraceae bacterium]